jgi:hypothetical protein
MLAPFRWFKSKPTPISVAREFYQVPSPVNHGPVRVEIWEAAVSASSMDMGHVDNVDVDNVDVDDVDMDSANVAYIADMPIADIADMPNDPPMPNDPRRLALIERLRQRAKD